MVFLFGLILWVSSISASTETLSWKDNFHIREGSYHEAYKYCVFKFSRYPSSSLASLCCNKESQKHDYGYPTKKYSHMLGYRVSGYTKDNKPEKFFHDLKDTFERFCYFPVDGLAAFYNQHSSLVKLFFDFPVLKYLVPYLIAGDVVQESAIDILIRSLTVGSTPATSRYPDIKINIVYSDGDKLVTEQSAKIIYAQLKKTGLFPNVQLVQVEQNENGEFLLEPKPFDPKDVEHLLPVYERRRLWLKNMWLSKLIVTLFLVPFILIVPKFLPHAIRRVILLLLIEELWRR